MLRKKINTPVTPYQRRRWLLGSAIIIGGFIGVAALFGWVMYIGSSKEIVAVANQFKPDASWKLESESIVPPRTLCIDVECPSVGRVWKTKNLVSKVELRKQLDKSGWDFPIEDDCLLDPGSWGAALPLCTARGNVDNYDISVSVRGSNTPGKTDVGLSVIRR